MIKKNIHNKLVRDKIPQVLSKKNIQCFIKTLNTQDYEKHLNLKLKEELGEFFQSNNNDE